MGRIQSMKLKTKQTVLIGLAFASILAFWQLYDQVVPVILENHFDVSTIATNMIMSVDNILAVFLLPVFGVLSDKVHTPMGKRTPFILFGTIAAVILMAVLALLTEGENFIGFIICLMLLLITMSVYRSPAVAYMPDVTPKPLRSKGNAIINLVGYIGGIFSTVVMMFLVTSTTLDDGTVEYDSFVPVFLTVAAFMLVCVLVMVFTVNENKAVAQADVAADEDKPEATKRKLEKPVMKSLVFILLSAFLWYCAYNGVTTSFSRYFESRFMVDAGGSSIYLTVATVAAIASFIPLGFVSEKLGRKKTVMGGIILMTACYAWMIFINHETPLLFVLFAIVGVGWAAINVNSFPMVVQMCSSADVGRYTGLYYAFTMAAQIFTPLLSGIIIDENMLGMGYGALFPYAVAFSLLSFVTMIFVRHGDSKPQPKKSVLENFDVDD